jgi:hypothetical protein
MRASPTPNRTRSRHPAAADPSGRQHALPAEAQTSIRSVVRVDITRIADSCGFVVPLMDYRDERRQLYRTADAWLRQDGPDAIRDYCDVNNPHSIDGLPGLSPFGEKVADEQRTRHAHEGHKI